MSARVRRRRHLRHRRGRRPAQRSRRRQRPDDVVMNTPDERVFGPQRPPVEWPARRPAARDLPRRAGAALRRRAADRGRRTARRRRRPGRAARLRHRRRTGTAARARPTSLRPGASTSRRSPSRSPRIPGELEAAHIGVVPTLRDPFTELLLPVKLLEYVHMGLPAIAPRLPVIERYFSDRRGALLRTGLRRVARAGHRCGLRGTPLPLTRGQQRAAVRLAELAWERQRERYLELMDGLAGAQPVEAGRTRRRRSFREAAGPV